MTAGGGAIGGGDQLLVEALHEGVAQREGGEGAHEGGGDEDQAEDPRDQPGAQAAPSDRRIEAGGHGAQAPCWGAGRCGSTGLRMYPTPRMVWIMGSRPLSILRRR